MDERSELQLARELAALREKHRFYQIWENALKPAARTAAAVPNTVRSCTRSICSAALQTYMNVVALLTFCFESAQKRPQSAAKGPRRKSAPDAADTTATTTEDSPSQQHTTGSSPACASSPLLIEEPVSRGRIRPRSAPASRRRRTSSVQLGAQQQLLSTANGSNSSTRGDGGGARISEELLRQQIARKKQEDQAFARELVGEMRAIAAEYLTMVEDANRFAGMLGIRKAFSLCDQQSLVAEPATTSNAPHFDESKVLFSSKLLIKVEQPGATTQPPRYLSLTAFTKEYNALKTKAQRQLEVLPASEAKTAMATERMFARRNSSAGSPGQQGAAAPATALGVRPTTANRNDEEMDDEMLEARFRQLLDDTIERKQQIDEQLQLLKELGWNTFR